MERNWYNYLRIPDPTNSNIVTMSTGGTRQMVHGFSSLIALPENLDSLVLQDDSERSVTLIPGYLPPRSASLCTGHSSGEEIHIQ